MFYGISEDITCALIARNELRKNGLTPSSNPGEFNGIFHGFLDDKKGVSDSERKKTILSYLEDSELAIKKIITVKNDKTGQETQKTIVVGINKE